jgi:mRNA interferase YafQ
MPSKANKKAKMPLMPDYTNQFTKDWTALTHSGRYNMGELKKAMLLLIAHDEPLPAHYLDHPLKGDWATYRECHIGGDFLLIYKTVGCTVYFVRAGTHSELFK